MVLKRAYFLLFVLISVSGFSQQPANVVKNIVPNGSFENYRKKSGNIKQAIPWQQIASVDFYQEPISNDTTSHRGAHTGNCYAGLRFQKKYKEFLQVKLAESLHRGTTYEFEMYFRLAFWSNASLKSLGALFTKVGYKSKADVVPSALIDSVSKKGSFINGYHWFKISGKYMADGGEKYLTIGNFSPNVKKDMVRMNIFKLGFKEAYYFVDDISLVKAKEVIEKVKVEIVGSFNLDGSPQDSVLEVKNNIKVGEKVQLKNIFFENGRYYLLPESYSELNKLAQYLLRNPGMEIQINGHSDNSGSKGKNQKISEQRAREVFEYLIKKGVQNKMYFKGYGSSLPVAGNETEADRAKNRRVEFEIIKN
ncbi:MAG: OmpA/MotB domain protein [Bacteroidota bacterium]|jgi:outer membrane protein OmpA-like peptidoglycan-associated protein|nr:OmpA/MotB domain protein [Bacteroidota bacterium]